jgi:hypothetical protein
MHGTKNQVHDSLATWLWKDDTSKETADKRFILKRPSLSDSEEELKEFMAVESDTSVESIAPALWTPSVGALMLNTSNPKRQSRNESRQWKALSSNKVHPSPSQAKPSQAKESLY